MYGIMSPAVKNALHHHIFVENKKKYNIFVIISFPALERVNYWGAWLKWKEDGLDCDTPVGNWKIDGRVVF